MELNELKASWNALDKRLAETEIVNLRMVKEMVSQKTKSAHDRIVSLNLYNIIVNLLILSVVFPYVYMNTPISTTSFVIVETMMVVGFVPLIRKHTLLSAFDFGEKQCKELNGLVLRYKKVCHYEPLWMIGCVTIAMIAFYISELGFNERAGYVLSTRILLVAGLTLLTLAMGYVLAQWQRRRHTQQLREIERGLEELREFEE